MDEREQFNCATAADGPIDLEADVVIVGLGAGGSMAFRELARRGRDVLALEMGEHVPTAEMEQVESRMMPRLYQESAARSTEDFSVAVLQGKGVGGSTVHNTNICKRLPEPVRAHWADEFGLDWAISDELRDDFDAVEDLLDVKRVPDRRVNENNRVLERGLEATGWEGGRLRHNRSHDDCRESGFCELGCPNQGKQNAAKVLVPEALEEGGRLWTHARVESVTTEGRRATGVRGVAADPVDGTEGATLRVRADNVILAASATGSAAIAQNSDLPDPHALAGTNLHMHPGATVIGLFDDPVRSWLGNPQTVDCTEFLETGADPERRAWIVPGAAHPAGAAMFVPGFGREHGEWMRQYPHMASMIVMLHDHTSGRVRPGDGEAVRVHYSPDRREYDHLAEGMRGAGELMLAAGAEEVVVPTSPPVRASTAAELGTLDGSDLGPLNPPLAAVHPMSTLWMGDDPRRSVVDPRGEHHQVDDLWVADGSLFPTSIGAPPQISIYTMGRRVARALHHSTATG